MSSRASNSSGGDSNDEFSRKRSLVPSTMAVEEIEPYVRRKRSHSGQSSEKAKKRLDTLNEEEQNLLRTCINSRERRRMHDLNDALDDLRRVIPYSENSNSRKMSKINTVILAANWIRQLTVEVNQLKSQNEKLVCEYLSLKSTGTVCEKLSSDICNSADLASETISSPKKVPCDTPHREQQSTNGDKLKVYSSPASLFNTPPLNLVGQSMQLAGPPTIPTPQPSEGSSNTNTTLLGATSSTVGIAGGGCLKKMLPSSVCLCVACLLSCSPSSAPSPKQISPPANLSNSNLSIFCWNPMGLQHHPLASL